MRTATELANSIGPPITPATGDSPLWSAFIKSLKPKPLPTFDEMATKMTFNAISRPLLAAIYRPKGA